MIRYCNGQDLNLLMCLHPETGQKLDKHMPGEIKKPCDCGYVFDDAKFMVIWPHRSIR